MASILSQPKWVKTYLHFLSFLNHAMAYVTEIIPHQDKTPFFRLVNTMVADALATQEDCVKSRYPRLSTRMVKICVIHIQEIRVNGDKIH